MTRRVLAVVVFALAMSPARIAHAQTSSPSVRASVFTTSLAGGKVSRFAPGERFLVLGEHVPPNASAIVAIRQTRTTSKWIPLVKATTSATGTLRAEVRVPSTFRPGKASIGVLVGKTPAIATITIAGVLAPRDGLQGGNDRKLLYLAIGGMALLFVGALLIVVASRRRRGSADVPEADGPEPDEPVLPSVPEVRRTSQVELDPNSSPSVQRLRREVQGWSVDPDSREP